MIKLDGLITPAMTYLNALQAEKLNDSKWQDTSLQDFMIDDDNTCDMV